MSWLTDLAGKAENLLNKIDQNAAVVLKDKNLINEQLQDVIWKTSSTVRSSEPSSVTSPSSQISPPSPLPRSAPSGAASPVRRPSPSRSDLNYLKRNDEDDLLRFLNSSDSTQYTTEELRGSPSGASAPSAGSSSPVYLADIPRGGHSRSHSQGGMSSMASSYMSSGRDEQSYQQCFKPVESIDRYNQDDEVTQLPASDDVLVENNLLKNEIRCLNNELALLLQRSKAAEKEADTTGQELRVLKQKRSTNEDVDCQLQTLRTRLKESEKAALTLSVENQRLKDNQVASSSQDSKVAEELGTALERLKQLTSEHDSLIQESNELRLQISRLQATINGAVQQNDRYRQQILEVSSEAEQYRARATRVLQEKEKLISSLQASKCVTGESSDSMADQEIEQLREELHLLHQESASQSKLLLSVRNDLQKCELLQEEQRQKAEIEIDRLQKKLQEERSRRVAAEEDSRAHLEELQFAKKEMNQRNESLQKHLLTKEAELSRLKQQSQLSCHVSKASSESAELEARVRNLATSLIQKQGALEAMIAERNSLKFKLERIENLNVTGSSFPSSSSNGGTVLSLVESENGTRMRVPTLLSENPSDTGVTRRVKRAYSSLDTLGIRVGTFLRRYPLARILVILYMVLLHFWVAIVLFSYSPEGQSSGAMKTPPAVTY